MTTQRRMQNVSECLYSLYAWFLLSCHSDRDEISVTACLYMFTCPLAYLVHVTCGWPGSALL